MPDGLDPRCPISRSPTTAVHGPPRPGPLFAGLALAEPRRRSSPPRSRISAALRAREHDRPRPARRDVAAAGRAGVAAVGVAARRERRRAETSTAGSSAAARRRAFQVQRRPLDPPLGAQPAFMLSAADGDTLNRRRRISRSQNDPDRIGIGARGDAGARRTTTRSWPRRSPSSRPTTGSRSRRGRHAAAADPLARRGAARPELFLHDGCVVEVDDAELGPVRQVGASYRAARVPDRPAGRAAAVGRAHRRGEGRGRTPLADAQRAGAAGRHDAQPAAPAAPLAGITVLDLGLAVAGPVRHAVLADLGADVIKVNALYDSYWHSTPTSRMAATAASAASRSTSRTRAAMESCASWSRRADVVQHNMRYEAAVRLGVDYERLKKIKPDLIYCHTRGFETGRARALPGNDQTGAALAGVQYGRRRHRQRRQAAVEPHLARRHRQRLPLRDRDHPGALPPRPHGRGPVRRHLDHLRAAAQHVVSRWRRPDGSGFDRPQRRRDAARLQRAVPPVRDRRRLAVRGVATEDALGPAVRRDRRAGARGRPALRHRRRRAANDAGARAISAHVPRGAGDRMVRQRSTPPACPCEICDPRVRARACTTTPRFRRRGWIVDAPASRSSAGWTSSALAVRLFRDAGRVQGPPLIVGQHSREILARARLQRRRRSTSCARTACSSGDPARVTAGCAAPGRRRSPRATTE